MSDAALVAQASRVSAAVATDCGRLRNANEDRHYVDVDRGVAGAPLVVNQHPAQQVVKGDRPALDLC